MNEPRIMTDDLVCCVCSMPWEFCGCLPSDLAAHHAEAAYEIGKQYQHAKRRRMPIWGWVLLAVVSAVLTWFVLPASPQINEAVNGVQVRHPPLHESIPHHGLMLDQNQVCSKECFLTIWVRDCAGKFLSIYADKQLTIPMANPMVVNAERRWTYYSAVRQQIETIQRWSIAEVEIDTCPDKEAKP